MLKDLEFGTSPCGVSCVRKPFGDMINRVVKDMIIILKHIIHLQTNCRPGYRSCGRLHEQILWLLFLHWTGCSSSCIHSGMPLLKVSKAVVVTEESSRYPSKDNDTKIGLVPLMVWSYRQTLSIKKDLNIFSFKEQTYIHTQGMNALKTECV